MLYGLDVNFQMDLFNQAIGQGVCGECDAPESSKRSTFSHKMGQKLGFCLRVEGSSKSPPFESIRSTFGTRPPKINLDYWPVFNIEILMKITFLCGRTRVNLLKNKQTPTTNMDKLITFSQKTKRQMVYP